MATPAGKNFLLYLFVFLLSLGGAKLEKLVDFRWKTVSLIYLRFTNQLPVSPIPHGEPSRCLALIDINMNHRLHTNTLSRLLVGRSRRLTNCVSFIQYILKMWTWATRKTTGRLTLQKPVCYKNARNRMINPWFWLMKKIDKLRFAHGSKDGGFIADHYFDKQQFELFECQKRLCEGDFTVGKSQVDFLSIYYCIYQSMRFLNACQTSGKHIVNQTQAEPAPRRSRCWFASYWSITATVRPCWFLQLASELRRSYLDHSR